MTDLLSSPRPRAVDEIVDALTGTELARSRAETDTLLADHGVTYGTDDATPGAPGWHLDPVPVVIDELEWSSLDAALVERAQVLDEVLVDLYGARRLLTDALLPPEIVLAHPGFLRAVDGLRLPTARELVLTATDLTRDASGGWVAIADRTQAPSGAGYAMEDRRVVARVRSGVYRQASIQRLGPFFHALKLALQDAARAGATSPRVVLLTSGPHSETAFDQSYLAAMLGLPMVEGSDLLVREGRVWMQGLDALEPVDVILRRVDADYCDPLELRSDSRLGVPGLVRALRAGSVSVVNPLGSSVLENPALLAHLPRLARVVLGRDLALPTPPTYWCGDDTARAHVLAHLDRLVLKPTARGSRSTTVLGWTLDPAALDSLAQRIAANPSAWVGQEPVGEPWAPDTSAAVLRTFAVAHDGSYRVMAGGLARVAPDPSQQRVSGALGAIARDVWVLSSETGTLADPWLSGPGDAGPQRAVSGISPRTAENMFWLGRYAERAGDTVRHLRALVDRWNDYHHSPRSVGGRALGALLAAADVATPATWPGATTRTASLDLRALLLDRTSPRSVARSVRSLIDASSAVRDQLSGDSWLPLASMERSLAGARGEKPPAADQLTAQASAETAGMQPVLDRLLEALLALAGIGAESMVRDAGWRLLDAGRRLERAQHLVESLAATVTDVRPAAVDALVIESVLITHESVLTYRRRNQGPASVAGVLDLLLVDPSNPRSLAFQLDRLRDDLADVPTALRAPDLRDRLLQDVTDVLTELDPVAVAALVTDDGRRRHLAETLDSMRWRLRALADEIALVHFAQPVPSRTLDDTWGVESADDIAGADDSDDTDPDEEADA
ncbi:MAG TPA: circularly permuted type 2 ATP-grasp protein [Cellulomonas sp.]|uniref:circularly permuted type 2 ATP-grasp protein n=1 Tax=Cellulomonas sp. TaxID=40001 RepID=UPI002E33FCAF|nr:circularly permuted type 2 ATP-grasp protein [Cellulomonas sp.]HEX5332275.1 circularly permuted type 2 ATP-grasp protein [Cellulomonas sp.]